MMLTKLPSSAATSWLLSIAILTTPAVVAQRVANNVSESVHQASDLGRIDSAKEISVTVRLNMRDQDAFDKVVDALYEPGSPTFHKWLTDEELKKYAPVKEQTDAVRKELESHGLTILSTDENGFSIRARGSAANIERAFNTEIHEFQRNGKVFRANVQNVRLTGAAGAYVSAVAGIESHQVHPLIRRAVNPRTNEPPPAVALKKVETSGGLEAYITDQFLSAPTAFTFNTPGSALPVGVYFGNVYNQSPTLISDYTPTQLQALYGLPAAYKKGLDGTGQTIVLLEAYGYPTIEADANAFFNLAGLPPLTSSNFNVIYPVGKPASPDLGILAGWNFEIALDVQWAHSIAPGAKILVVAAPGEDNESFQAAMSYIIDHRLGNSISDSWEEDLDILAGPLENESYDQILEIAAAKGISFHFSTGDSGDNGLGNPIGAAGVPSNSPHATAIGGTSIVNNIYGSGSETLGWGTSIVEVNDNGVLDPPLVLPFNGGSGGGESIFFPKPIWQKNLPGTGRQTPDVSALADPFTGVPIVVTDQGTQYLFAGVGGTSLASPIFTAIWAIADQKAGHPLGQAAPTIAGLKAGQLLDVLPQSSPTNVAGTIFDKSGATFYSPTDLFTGLLYNTREFTSALWNAGGGTNYTLSFGLDTSLTVTKGWDNVTGYGTPNGLVFLDAVAK
jgi:subtilase family serine protease